jgi:DNA-nicking Smr family endonuclease
MECRGYSPGVTKKPFHAPFERLAGLKKELARPPAPPPPPPRPASPPPPPREPGEDELWAHATAGTRPVRGGGPGAAPLPSPPSRDRAPRPDLDGVDEQQALVRGEPRFDFAPGDALVEGWVTGLDAEVVRRLKRGDYAVERRLDLHGLTRDEARGAVDRFLRESRLGGTRCVLLVHGRGRHSETELPVIKEALHGWLASGRFGRQVLAFASARPADGGAGALYVLLRRAGR